MSKLAVFGASKLFLKAFKGEIFSNDVIQVIYDNNQEKWNTALEGYVVSKPQYDPEIEEIAIAIQEKYVLMVINQVMMMGYRKISVLSVDIEGRVNRIRYDYTGRSYNGKDKNIVMVYYDSSSYSNLYGLEFMAKKLNLQQLQIKRFNADKSDNEYYYDLLTGYYLVVECSLPREANAFPKLIQLWHGFPLKAMGKMSVGYTTAQRTGVCNFWHRFDKIASYGKNYSALISACFSLNMEQFIECGMPRNDLLFHVNGRKILKEILNYVGEPRIIMYLPTFRQIENRGINGSASGYLYNMDGFSYDTLDKFCRKNNIIFIIKPHPSDMLWASEKLKESEYIRILTEEQCREYCTYSYLNAVDLLITDYSSVYFDFLLLNRPIVFLGQDETEYEDNRGFLIEPLDFWRPGEKVYAFQQCMEVLEKLICFGEDRYQQQRKLVKELVHKHCDGHSSERLFASIENDNSELKNVGTEGC